MADTFSAQVVWRGVELGPAMDLRGHNIRRNRVRLYQRAPTTYSRDPRRRPRFSLVLYRGPATTEIELTDLTATKAAAARTVPVLTPVMFGCDARSCGGLRPFHVPHWPDSRGLPDRCRCLHFRFCRFGVLSCPRLPNGLKDVDSTPIA
jgi:hypothetical protein